jgi:hypothetical protein
MQPVPNAAREPLAALLQLQCSPAFNFSNTNQKDMKFYVPRF